MTIQFRLLFALLFTAFIVGCASVDRTAKGRVQFNNTEHVVEDVSGPKPLVNPNPPKGIRLSKKDFIHPSIYSDKRGFGVAKDSYKQAIKNANSGYANDAFIGALAYWSGYYKYDTRSYRLADGRSLKKARHYMERASDLGSPEASYILFGCYNARQQTPDWSYMDSPNIRNGDRTAGIVQPEKLTQRCILDSENEWATFQGGSKDADKFSVPPNSAKARMYLERVALQGHDFYPNFNPIPKIGVEVKPLDRLDARAKMLIAQFKHQSVVYTASQHAKANNRKFRFLGSDRDHRMYKETYASACTPELIQQLEFKAVFDEIVMCKSKRNDARYCPGFGYDFVRHHLETCMYLAPTYMEWNNFYQRRLDYYHAYFDGKELLNLGKTVHLSQGDAAGLKRVEQISQMFESKSAELTNKWNRIAALHDRRAKAEERADTKRELETERRRAAYRNKQRTEQAAWDEKHSQNAQGFDPIGNTFNDDIDRMKGETMRNINAQQRRKHRSSGNSSSSYDRSETSSRSDIHQRPAPRIPTPLCKQPPLPILGKFCPGQILPNNTVGPPSDKCKQEQKAIDTENKARYAEWEANETNKCPKGGKGGGKGRVK